MRRFYLADTNYSCRPSCLVARSSKGAHLSCSFGSPRPESAATATDCRQPSTGVARSGVGHGGRPVLGQLSEPAADKPLGDIQVAVAVHRHPVKAVKLAGLQQSGTDRLAVFV